MKTNKLNKFKKTDNNENTYEKFNLILGGFLIIFSIFLTISSLSHIFNGDVDQSQVSSAQDIFNAELETKNILGKLGAFLSHFFFFLGFGLSSMIFYYILFRIGLYLVSSYKFSVKKIFELSFISILISVFLGYFSTNNLSGVFGYQINKFIGLYLGDIGTFFMLIFLMFSYVIIKFNLKNIKLNFNLSKYPSYKKNIKKEDSLDDYDDQSDDNMVVLEPDINVQAQVNDEKDTETQQMINKVAKLENIDPTVELSRYKQPSIDILKEANAKNITTKSQLRAELESNKNKIVQALSDFRIEISNITAVVGPTVTLYEITPAPGIKISKIKNLEDDIARAISAGGIRIIAPMPGKGTIGIEVSNKNPSIVYLKPIIKSKKFQTSDMDLPCILGKDIHNESCIFDLSKMPHLLIAGSTGQGKSVGINTILASLIYRKHPSEIKFVLVDPKKVELSLFTKIERHYLAKLESEEDPIITDTKKVINTLNSLCLEMDNRYNLLKNAMVRNIKEYNNKYISRHLNPEEGHKFLPYIVLVIDEFADLIITAGKEIETPIARLAQLARAIGIHLIVATQRPSVNVITGIIKANFPARIAYRVMSKIDSRTILDSSGAERLIGKGDMLFSFGSNLVRLQTPFITTKEVEQITDFIGNQMGFPSPYILPEYDSDDNDTSKSVDEERDSKFEEAARVIINSQQGSASFIQRKLKLGYNRSARIIDQLENAGIIGPFEGSKGRKVLVQDEETLEQILSNENEQ